ncbi:INO80 complex subunit D [Trichonephila clavipes]|nr:INO80 complex subunit D [Trichonephila clavipes]
MISQFKSPRIDIVFDQYVTPSIKDCERLRRNETTSTVSIGPNQIRHHNFAGELKNTQFKEALGVPNSSNVNDVRFYLFSKTYQSKELDDNFEKKCRSFDSSSLPPCKAELYQHLLRVRYVTKFWRNAHLKNPSSLSPLASGWIVNDDKYDFVWFAGEQFPSSAADIVIKSKGGMYHIRSHIRPTNADCIELGLTTQNPPAVALSKWSKAVEMKLFSSKSRLTKLCKQRRINGYAFCIRHILEDKSAPFKQCAHVARYNKQKCTNPIPCNENRE